MMNDKAIGFSWLTTKDVDRFRINGDDRLLMILSPVEFADRVRRITGRGEPSRRE